MQNYSNFQVFYVDDATNRQAIYQLYAHLSDDYPKLKNKVTLLGNDDVIGTIGNRDATIR